MACETPSADLIDYIARSVRAVGTDSTSMTICLVSFSVCRVQNIWFRRFGKAAQGIFGAPLASARLPSRSYRFSNGDGCDLITFFDLRARVVICRNSVTSVNTLRSEVGRLDRPWGDKWKMNTHIRMLE